MLKADIASRFQHTATQLLVGRLGLPTFISRLEVSNASVEMNFVLNPGFSRKSRLPMA
jgi:hypothetical protein